MVAAWLITPLMSSILSYYWPLKTLLRGIDQTELRQLSDSNNNNNRNSNNLTNKQHGIVVMISN